MVYMRMSLPAGEVFKNFHDEIFLLILCVISLRGVDLLPSISIGQPRLVPTSFAFLTLSGFLKSLINLHGVLGLELFVFYSYFYSTSHQHSNLFWNMFTLV